MPDLSNIEKKITVRELSEKEIKTVNGGLWGLVIAAAAAVLAGCATPPKKKQHNWADPHNNFPHHD